MDSKTFNIYIILISLLIAVEAFPQQNDHLDERLEPRGLGDYVPSWFWSSKNAGEEKTKLPKFSVDQQDEKSNIMNNHKNGQLPDDESPLKNHSESQILGHGLDVEKIEPVQEIPEGVQPENVDRILEELKEDVQNTDTGEKTKTLNLWKSLSKTVSETTSPYVEVVYKNARHFIDIGAFGTSKRSRCFYEMTNPLGDLIKMLLSLLGFLGGGTNGNNANLGNFLGLGMPPVALSGSNSNAGAVSLANLGGTIPGSLQFVSMQDIAKRGGLQPNLGGGNQLIDLSKLGGGSQVQPNQPNGTMDPNNLLLMALLLRLLGNGNGPTTKGTDTTGIDFSRLPKGFDINSIDFSKLPEGVDSSGLITLIRQLTNQPETNKKNVNDNSRVIVLKTSDLNDLDTNPFQLFNIRGTPKERFKKISRKFKNDPDAREKIIIVDELNRLKNDSNIDSDLRDLIEEMESRINNDQSYKNALKIVKQFDPDGENRTRKFKNVRFIDGTDEFEGFSDDNDDKLWNELVKKLSTKYERKNIDDPNTLRSFFKDLNLKSFD